MKNNFLKNYVIIVVYCLPLFEFNPFRRTIPNKTICWLYMKKYIQDNSFFRRPLC